MKSVLAWHFVGKTLRDGRAVPPDGETLRHEAELIMCEKGLHASKRLLDALQYAPGNTISRVRCSGKMLEDHDKFVCSERTILWRINGENILRSFACTQALAVAHLWDMPASVRQYLETERPSLRAAACKAARAAAWDAAWDAAWAAERAAERAAAWAAARAAERDAAWAAAWAATRDAAWAAAWAAARDAAWAAARAATRDATRDAERDAERDAAWPAAWAAARDAEDKMLTKMVMQVHKKIL